MDSNWKLLMDLGLPDGPARAVRRDMGDPAAVRLAVAQIAAGTLRQADTDVLVAWLAAFKHHWPTAFADVLGECGEAVRRNFAGRVDPNRYLKLRRVATSNLAVLL